MDAWGIPIGDRLGCHPRRKGCSVSGVVVLGGAGGPPMLGTLVPGNVTPIGEIGRGHVTYLCRGETGMGCLLRGQNPVAIIDLYYIPSHSDRARGLSPSLDVT